MQHSGKVHSEVEHTVFGPDDAKPLGQSKAEHVRTRSTGRQDVACPPLDVLPASHSEQLGVANSSRKLTEKAKHCEAFKMKSASQQQWIGRNSGKRGKVKVSLCATSKEEDCWRKALPPQDCQIVMTHPHSQEVSSQQTSTLP